MTRQSSQAPLGSVRPCGIPTTAFLLKYQDGGAFADCYVVRVEGAVTQSGFVKAFYTTRLFKIERTLLEWVARKTATDEDAQRLADGGAATFSAWRVEEQGPDQLLLADFTGRTRSWLMAVPSPQDAGSTAAATWLYFGSAVVPRRSRTGESSGMGWGFHGPQATSEHLEDLEPAAD